MNGANEASENRWLYAKLYFGEAIDKMDSFLIDVHPEIDRADNIEKWFFLRYFDESGLHLRLRALARSGAEDELRYQLDQICSTRMNQLHDLLPSEYYPMVTPSGGLDTFNVAAAHNDVKVIFGKYEPETDKFGRGRMMEVAESVFMESSKVACKIFELENKQVLSRKTLVPFLMRAAFQAFRPKEGSKAFWKNYSIYWLGGDTPAAEDWRDKFSFKCQELSESGFSILSQDSNLVCTNGQRLIDEWGSVLQAAAQQYDEHNDGSVSPSVLCFNFAHLMNNRLGLMALEESYMASLLEGAEG